MSNQRVQSKNLFNFRPQGYVDEDIVAFYEKMKTDFNIDMVEWSDSLKDQSESEYVAGMRGMMDGMMVTSPFGTDPAIVEVGKVLVKEVTFNHQAHGSCNHSELRVPTWHHGNFEVPVFVHTPKVSWFSWEYITNTMIFSSLPARVRDLVSSTPTEAAVSVGERASMQTTFPTWLFIVELLSSMWTTDWLQSTGLEEIKPPYLIS